MIVFANNPWGVSDGQEAQRQDLWRVGLKPAISYFASLDEEQFAAVGLSKSDLPDDDTASLYAVRVILPVQKIIPTRIIQGTVPRNLPSFVDALDTVRIDFLHEAGGDRSPIYTLLHIWRSIIRVGRVGGVGETTLLLPDESFKPQFKFDIDLKLLSGKPDELLSAEALVVGAEYALVKCWPRVIQHATIDRTKGAQLHILSVQFSLQEIL